MLKPRLLLFPLWMVSAVLPLRSFAQNLSSQDSVDLRVAAVLASLDTFRVAPDTARIWLWIPARTSDDLRSDQTITGLVAARLKARYPTVHPAPNDGELFLCPPGVQVRMPGRGCPILDNGLIVSLGRLHTSSDTVYFEVSLIQSERGLTWAVGHTVILVRKRGGWDVLRITDRFIT